MATSGLAYDFPKISRAQIRACEYARSVLFVDRLKRAYDYPEIVSLERMYRRT